MCKWHCPVSMPGPSSAITECHNNHMEVNLRKTLKSTCDPWAQNCLYVSCKTNRK